MRQHFAYIVIGYPSREDADEIAHMLERHDVTLVHPLTSTHTGRHELRRNLFRAGLSALQVDQLGMAGQTPEGAIEWRNREYAPMMVPAGPAREPADAPKPKRRRRAKR